MPMSKRIMDLVLTSMLVVFAAPIMVMTAILVRLDSRGPIFFVQDRVGFRGEPFQMIKFRSMYHESDARRPSSDREGICYKSRHDPRITKVGRILRRTSLDELPQLFNVLRGEMSLVGPRPALPNEVAAYPDRALSRLNSVPGITGLWQVSGRADIDFDRMVTMDLAYQRRRSLTLDFWLLLRTVRAVISGRGAY